MLLQLHEADGGTRSAAEPDSPGSAVPTGTRLRGVPGADKGIAWHGRSDSGWDVCWSNSGIDTGVDSAATPLFDSVCRRTGGACSLLHSIHARGAYPRYLDLALTGGEIKWASSNTCAGAVNVCFGGKAAAPLGFPFHYQSCLSWEIPGKRLLRERRDGCVCGKSLRRVAQINTQVDQSISSRSQLGWKKGE